MKSRIFIPKESEHADPLPEAPYPGIRPFFPKEAAIFFGRNDQTAATLRLLTENKFLALLGTSGSGKSSLINAGLIPAVESRIMRTAPAPLIAGSTDAHGGPSQEAVESLPLLIINMSPGRDPFGALAGAFARAMADVGPPAFSPRVKAEFTKRAGQEEKSLEEQFKEILKSGSTDGRTLLERVGIHPEQTVILIVDQFEELFHLIRKGDEDATFGAEFSDSVLSEVETFVITILGLVNAKPYHSHVIIGMRSDFLKDCAIFPELTEFVSRSMYIIPVLTRDEIEDVIRKPILHSKYQTSISEVEICALLNELVEGPDRLPLLQDFLARAYRSAKPSPEGARTLDGFISATRSSVPDPGLKIGFLRKSMDDHGWEVIGSNKLFLNEVRLFFAGLFEVDASLRLVRKKATVEELATASGLPEERIVVIAAAFGGEGPGWVYQSGGGEGGVLDLAHEALIRNWELFSGDPWCRPEQRFRVEAIRKGEFLLEGGVSLTEEMACAFFETLIGSDSDYALIPRSGSVSKISRLLGIDTKTSQALVSSLNGAGKVIGQRWIPYRGRVYSISTPGDWDKVFRVHFKDGLTGRGIKFARAAADVLAYRSSKENGERKENKTLASKGKRVWRWVYGVMDVKLPFLDEKKRASLKSALAPDGGTPESVSLKMNLELPKQMELKAALDQNEERLGRVRWRNLTYFYIFPAFAIVMVLVGLGYKAIKLNSDTKFAELRRKNAADRARVDNENWRENFRRNAEKEKEALQSQAERQRVEIDAAKERRDQEQRHIREVIAERESIIQQYTTFRETFYSLRLEQEKKIDNGNELFVPLRIRNGSVGGRVIDRIGSMMSSPQDNTTKGVPKRSRLWAGSSLESIPPKVEPSLARLLRTPLWDRQKSQSEGPPESAPKADFFTTDEIKFFSLKTSKEWFFITQSDILDRGSISSVLLFCSPDRKWVAYLDPSGNEPVPTILGGVPENFLITDVSVSTGARAQPLSRTVTAVSDTGGFYRWASVDGNKWDIQSALPSLPSASNAIDIIEMQPFTYCSAATDGKKVLYGLKPGDTDWSEILSDGSMILMPNKVMNRLLTGHDKTTELLEQVAGDGWKQQFWIEHDAPVTVLAISENGAYCATGTQNGKVIVVKTETDRLGKINLTSGGVVTVQTELGTPVTALGWYSVGGRLLLAIGDESGAVYLTSEIDSLLSSGKQSAKLTRLKSLWQDSSVSSFRFSGDNLMLFGTKEGSLWAYPLKASKTGSFVTFNKLGGNNGDLAIYGPHDGSKLNAKGLLKSAYKADALGSWLDPSKNYIAARWDYSFTPRYWLQRFPVKVSIPGGSKKFDAWPVDFGPPEIRGDFAISKGLYDRLKKEGLKDKGKINVQLQGEFN